MRSAMNRWMHRAIQPRKSHIIIIGPENSQSLDRRTNVKKRVVHKFGTEENIRSTQQGDSSAIGPRKSRVHAGRETSNMIANIFL